MFNVKRNEPVICKDGFKMSIQASRDSYCEPRINNAPIYTKVEVGFPSSSESLLHPYFDGDVEAGNPCNGVYAYVPVNIVTLVIAKHGGMVSGEVPRGIPHLPA